MSRILRRLELVEDDWVAIGLPVVAAAAGTAADAPRPAADPQRPAADEFRSDTEAVIVPFVKFREHPETWSAREGRLGVRLAPADKVEDLAPHLSRLALVAVEFTGPGEGRGYTQAKLLRQRYKFTGEVRAVGHVKQDQVYLMSRVGIDSFELSASEKPEEALATLERFKVAYTPGAPLRSLSRERFHV
ncbi:MAG: DUF934 domain-containing protein [Gammaproteobacteria bacterium]